MEREDYAKSYLNMSVNIFECRVMSHMEIQKESLKTRKSKSNLNRSSFVYLEVLPFRTLKDLVLPRSHRFFPPFIFGMS